MLFQGPDTRVVEMRISGSPATSPEELLDAAVAVEVAGDGSARLVRPADRLRRPVPGPVLQTGARPTPRIVEGYLWGDLLGRRVWRGIRLAAWLLLLPFSLINAAYWMLPPAPETGAGRTLPRILRVVLTGLLQVIGLGLTILLISQLATAGLVVAGAIGLLPAVIVVFLLYGLSAERWRAPQADQTEQRNGLAVALMITSSGTWMLRAAHVLVGLGAVVLPLVAKPAWTLVDVINETLAGGGVLFGLLLIPAALLGRRDWSQVSRQFRPMLGGWLAAPMVFLAWLLGFGFGSAATSLGQLVASNSTLTVPNSYQLINAAWGVTAIFVGVAAMMTLFGRLVARTTPTELKLLLHDNQPQVIKPVTKAWWMATWKRVYLPRLFVAGISVLAVCLLALVTINVSEASTLPWVNWLAIVGEVWLAALGVALPVMGFTLVKYPDACPYLGTLIHMVCFLPKVTHPVTPPCYSVKALPALVNRAVEHLTDPDTRVVLAGTGHGSLLVAATVARLLEVLEPDARERVGLVTAGSPLQWAYVKAFPGLVSHESLGKLAENLAGRWRALCRGTDPVGGAVTSWQRQLFNNTLLGNGFSPSGADGALPAATRTEDGGLILGGDHWLPDPQHGPRIGKRWRPGILCHKDYLSDPEWDRAVTLAAGLTFTQPNSSSSTTRLAGIRLSQVPPLTTAPEQAHSDSA